MLQCAIERTACTIKPSGVFINGYISQHKRVATPHNCIHSKDYNMPLKDNFTTSGLFQTLICPEIHLTFKTTNLQDDKRSIQVGVALSA